MGNATHARHLRQQVNAKSSGRECSELAESAASSLCEPSGVSSRAAPARLSTAASSVHEALIASVTRAWPGGGGLCRRHYYRPGHCNCCATTRKFCMYRKIIPYIQKNNSVCTEKQICKIDAVLAGAKPCPWQQLTCQ